MAGIYELQAAINYTDQTVDWSNEAQEADG